MVGAPAYLSCLSIPVKIHGQFVTLQVAVLIDEMLSFSHGNEMY
jgi:hypothetical protein